MAYMASFDSRNLRTAAGSKKICAARIATRAGQRLCGPPSLLTTARAGAKGGISRSAEGVPFLWRTVPVAAIGIMRAGPVARAPCDQRDRRHELRGADQATACREGRAVELVGGAEGGNAAELQHSTATGDAGPARARHRFAARQQQKIQMVIDRRGSESIAVSMRAAISAQLRTDFATTLGSACHSPSGAGG
jgi:hypothetical protein